MKAELRKDMSACSQICLDCMRVCSETLTGCLTKGGQHAKVDHVTELLDCILMCEATASFLSRGSSLAHRMCTLCAEICDRCAKSCEGWKDKEMDVCADECRGCAERCRARCHQIDKAPLPPRDYPLHPASHRQSAHRHLDCA